VSLFCTKANRAAFSSYVIFGAKILYEKVSETKTSIIYTFGPQTTFYLLELIVRPAQYFEFEMPDLDFILRNLISHVFETPALRPHFYGKIL